MQVEETNNQLLSELKVISELNANDLKLKLAQYIKEVENEIDRKNKEIEEYITSQAEFYGIKDFQDYIINVTTSYKTLIGSIIDSYDMRVINLIDSMKELEGNQIIALTNFNKIVLKEKQLLSRSDYDLRNIDIQNKLLKYDNFINALLDKYNDYNDIICECLFEYNICMSEVKEYISKLNFNQINSLIPANQSALSAIVLKIKSIFFGKKMFEKNVYNRLMNMINELDSSKESTIFTIKRGITVFELTLRNLLEKVNRSYESSILG